MTQTDLQLNEVNIQTLASDLAGQSDITKLETTLLDVTLLDPQSAAITLASLADNPSEAAAKLAHRVFTVFETTLLKQHLKEHPEEVITSEQTALTLATSRLPYKGGKPTERLLSLSGPVAGLRDELRAQLHEPASILSPLALEAYQNLCEKMKGFVPRKGVDHVLFTDNLLKLTVANTNLKTPTLGLGMEMIAKWNGQEPTMGGGTIDLGALVRTFAQSLT